MTYKLCFRVDASPDIGSGHAMRMLAVAQRWVSAGHRGLLCSHQLTDAMRAKWRCLVDGIHAMEADSYGAEDAEETLRYALDWGASGVLVDGYQFTSSFYEGIHRKKYSLLVIDDGNRSGCRECQLLIDQRVQAKHENYSQLPRERLLLGSGYAMLREEFTKYERERFEKTSQCEDILVMLGGADVKGQTLKVVECLLKSPLRNIGGVVHIVLGPLFRWKENNFFKQTSVSNFQIHVDPHDLAGIMSRCGYAISAAGTTLQELNYMGLATVLLVAAENQMEGAKLAVADNRALLACNEEEAVDKILMLMKSKKLAESLKVNGMKQYDSLGTSRIVHRIEQLFAVEKADIRYAM